MGKIIQFFREVRLELGKVAWPTRRQALKTTGIVILFCAVVALFLGAIDYGLTELISVLVS